MFSFHNFDVISANRLIIRYWVSIWTRKNIENWMANKKKIGKLLQLFAELCWQTSCGYAVSWSHWMITWFIHWNVGVSRWFLRETISVAVVVVASIFIWYLPRKVLKIWEKYLNDSKLIQNDGSGGEACFYNTKMSYINDMVVEFTSKEFWKPSNKSYYVVYHIVEHIKINKIDFMSRKYLFGERYPEWKLKIEYVLKTKIANR